MKCISFSWTIVEKNTISNHNGTYFSKTSHYLLLMWAMIVFRERLGHSKLNALLPDNGTKIVKVSNLTCHREIHKSLWKAHSSRKPSCESYYTSQPARASILLLVSLKSAFNQERKEGEREENRYMSMVKGEVCNMNARKGSGTTTYPQLGDKIREACCFFIPQVRIYANDQKLAFIHRIFRVHP